MKKVIMGSALLMSGLLADAVILAGSMANDWTHNGQLSALWTIRQYGLMPALIGFSAVAVIGLLLSVWGTVSKER